MRPHILQAALLIVCALWLLVGLTFIAKADSPDPEPRIITGECAGAHGWVRYEDGGTPVATYSVADASCPEDVGP
jgi:hypothetical protein